MKHHFAVLCHKASGERVCFAVKALVQDAELLATQLHGMGCPAEVRRVRAGSATPGATFPLTTARA